MNQLNIHDIKSLETIPDISFYLFVFFILLAVLLLVAVIYILFKFFKRKKSDKYIYYYKLKNIDFSNAKDAAYKITEYGKKIVVHDREIKLYEELIHELENYKYKKEVNAISEVVKQKYEIFMDSIDV